ncbi:MAG: S-adenosylmethionine:tRNA ribosyltransferase-isomerase [Cytophagaceae bacterium]
MPVKRNLNFPVNQFNYDLPSDRIAAFPLEKRDSSKLLVYKNGSIRDAVYHQIDQFLPADSLLVFNNARVVQARLFFKTSTGAGIEIFCLEPAGKHLEVSQAMQQTERTQWKCLVGGAKKWREEKIALEIKLGESLIILTAKLIGKESDAFIVEFCWTPEGLSFGEILETAGRVPLPPYIKRELEEEDKKRYQTIYAQHAGSVAAPTAGLHFTPEVFDTLREKNISLEYLTLHIGAGTFKPVKTDNIREHEMHSEQILVEKHFILKLINSLEKGVVAVGTTSLRTLESLYWLGLKLHLGVADLSKEITIDQWDPYELDSSLSTKQALEALLAHLEEQNQNVLLTRTRLMIVPGYEWKIVKVLATNFHQPKSTLVMLVAAFVGEDWKKIYAHALQNDYRFLSYGDGSLLFRS